MYFSLVVYVYISMFNKTYPICFFGFMGKGWVLFDQRLEAFFTPCPCLFWNYLYYYLCDPPLPCMIHPPMWSTPLFRVPFLALHLVHLLDLLIKYAPLVGLLIDPYCSVLRIVAKWHYIHPCIYSLLTKYAPLVGLLISPYCSTFD